MKHTENKSNKSNKSNIPSPKDVVKNTYTISPGVIHLILIVLFLAFVSK